MPPDARAFYKGKRILVTGGTGSIGSEIVRQLLTSKPAVVRILSRDDTKQAELQQTLPPCGNLRYVIGDVRDLYRTKRAMEGIDVVFHAAAMKHVPTCEYNPFEAVQTNVVGTMNVLQAALDAAVSRCVVISTDKAVNPANTMGVSKLMGERLVVAADAWARARTRFCAVRFGNVIGSRGSLVPLLLEQIRKGGPVTVTDPRMTRFMMTIPDAVSLVLQAGEEAEGGEVFILKMPAMKVGDFIQALIDLHAPRFGKDPRKVRMARIGIRPGEKMDEDLMTSEELRRAVDRGAMFAVLPAHRAAEAAGRLRIPPSLYRSDKTRKLSAAGIRDLLKRAGVA